MNFQTGDKIKNKNIKYYNYTPGGGAKTMIKKGTLGVIVDKDEDCKDTRIDVMFEEHFWRTCDYDEFDNKGGKIMIPLICSQDLELIRKQPIRKDEFFDDAGNIRRKVGQLGKAGSFGMYDFCPKCGGKMIKSGYHTQGYGSQSSGHSDLTCENCGWSSHIVYD